MSRQRILVVRSGTRCDIRRGGTGLAWPGRARRRGNPRGAVFQRFRRSFLLIDTRAEFFVTSIRMNNVSRRGDRERLGRFVQPALQMRVHSQALELIALLWL